MKKILVSCPTADVKDYAFNDWINNVKNFTYQKYDIHIVDNSETREYLKKIKSKYGDIASFERVSPIQYSSFKMALAKSHDKCRIKALKDNYDFLLHLESDVFPPLDIIERLLDHKKSIVGALYFIEQGEESKLMIQGIEGFGIAHRETYNFDETEIDFINGELRTVYSCGLGCVLIHKSILKKIPFRYEEGAPVHPDSFYFGDLNLAGKKVFVDTSILCEHRNTSLLRL